jgi:ribosomal protein S18 acetylase RimI-like enzyme
MKKAYLGRYEFDDDFGRLQFKVLEQWLSNTYWSPDIREAEIRKGAGHSALNLGCYLGSEQVGYLRVVSDKTRFAYILDVYVEASHRRQGIAENLVRHAMEHPEFQDVYLWLLATRDAQAVYRKAGFGPLPAPDNWMIIRKEKNRPAMDR